MIMTTEYTARLRWQHHPAYTPTRQGLCLRHIPALLSVGLVRLQLHNCRLLCTLQLTQLLPGSLQLLGKLGRVQLRHVTCHQQRGTAVIPSL